MRLFLHDGPSHLQILARSDVREFRDAAAAREFLRPLFADAGNRTAARDALRATGIWSDDDVLEQLAQRLVSDGLQVISCADPYVAAGRGTSSQQQQAQTTPLEDEEAALAEKAAEPGPEETHWIEIELLDDDGAPVANERYFVELPDGSSLSGRTDANGRARVEGVDPGTAKVSFPELDRSAYEGDG